MTTMTYSEASALPSNEPGEDNRHSTTRNSCTHGSVNYPDFQVASGVLKEDTFTVLVLKTHFYKLLLLL